MAVRAHLGIPTVADRIAQEVARRYLEPRFETASGYGTSWAPPARQIGDGRMQPSSSALFWHKNLVFDQDVKAHYDSASILGGPVQGGAGRLKNRRSTLCASRALG